MSFKVRLPILVCVILSPLTGFAQSQYVGPLNAGLGNGASVSCSACHSGSPSGGNANLPMAGTWRSGANLALSDSDGDGFNNAQEVYGSFTDFNVAGITPFTKAVGGMALANVYVVGDAGAIEAAVPSTLTITADSQVLGNTAVNIAVSPTLTAPITLTFKAGGAATTSTVYAVNATTSSFVPLAATDWSVDSHGSVTIKQLPAGTSAGTHDILVVRKIPVVPTAGAPRGGEEEEFECMTSLLPSSLLMFLSLMGLGLLVRRKA